MQESDEMPLFFFFWSKQPEARTQLEQAVKRKQIKKHSGYMQASNKSRAKQDYGVPYQELVQK